MLSRLHLFVICSTTLLAVCSICAAPPAAPKAKLPELKAPPAKVRSWSDTSGKFRTEAQFVELKGGKVALAKSDRRIEIPFVQLATEDQLFILREAIPLSDATAKLLVGKVVGVSDGDTITVLDFDKYTSKIRLEGIDAPESHQDFGTQAKKALSEKVFGQYARVEWKEKDKYKRILGNVFVDDRFVNLELIEEGFAWHYKEYNKDEEFAAAEVRARDDKLGLWSQLKQTAPWDFRHNAAAAAVAAASVVEDGVPVIPKSVPSPESKLRASEPDRSEVTVYITKTGAKYHRAGCRHLAKSQILISLSDAQARYSACSVCNPP